jgi:cytochrome c551/c552/glucose/arabinose dehydrogenase
MLDRIDAKPAFFLGLSSPHPRLPGGPFEVVWTGLVQLKDRSPIRFHALVCGELTVKVDDVLVLKGHGENQIAQIGPGPPLDRPQGIYRLKITYRSLNERPARLQIWWQGPTFSPEPLAAWHLSHLTTDLTRAFQQDELAETGRLAVENLGCARCHSDAFPGVTESLPGPSLADVRGRIGRTWLLEWLAEPAAVRPNARMPALFAMDRGGFVECWLIAEHLLGSSAAERKTTPAGDHRRGRIAFISSGCAACHFLPDQAASEQPDLGRSPLLGLSDRLPAAELAGFLSNPHARYPDGRMPRLPLSPDTASDIAAFLLFWSRPAHEVVAVQKPPSPEEIDAVVKRLGVSGQQAAAAALVQQKRCAVCHPGLRATNPPAVPATVTTAARGCISGQSLPHFQVDGPTRKAIAAYCAVAAAEKHSSPLAGRQRLIDRLGCVRCHQRDSERPPPIEAAGSILGGSLLEFVPFQRTPRLSFPHQKYKRSHLIAAVRDGVTGLRPPRYTYRMPAFAAEADAVVRALAEADGDLPDAPEALDRKPEDPTLGPLTGPQLAGFQGYACVSCHVWNGKTLSDPDPAAVGTDLTQAVRRIRRDWFDRYLEAPARIHPGTPMPAIFPKGEPASLRSLLDGDSARQRDALWGYLALGKEAPSPKPPPPLPVGTPSRGEPPLVAQIPIHLPDGKTLESICVLYPSHDLLVYDLGTGALHNAYTGAVILREMQGRLRSFRVAGRPVGHGSLGDPALRLLGPLKRETASGWTFHGYDRLADGVRIRGQARFPSGLVEISETLRLILDPGARRLAREFRFSGIPLGYSVELRNQTLTASDGQAVATLHDRFPEPGMPPAVEKAVIPETGKIEGALERPGYRAIAYPRPKTISGEDRVMPGAVAVHPKDGRVFVTSLKTGEIFVVNDPSGDGRHARFDNYTRGLFQEALSMLAEPDALYVLHRRNLTRVVDSDGDGVADRFDRVAALPHGVADTYDYAYGLVRDREGAFVLTYAPYANRHLSGSGGAVRLRPAQAPEEIAYGFRNPLGWCRGPSGEIFFTDNQGEWVATNKLCHLTPGRFFGFPNPAQRQHAARPPGKPAVWVPYGWARSINGVAFDDSGAKFGPFAGQFFLAELMFGGGIIRANLEVVDGEFQGACYPFWGPGLLGPLSLAFDPRGRLWVGSITEPGWMAQPDRGALFRIDFNGQTPFEIKSIHALPCGFRLVLTRAASQAKLRDLASYRIEHFRYEYTGAYGSPELDRSRLTIARVDPAPDGLSVDLITAPLVKDRVYLIQAPGIRSPAGETLVHPIGAYTLNAIPSARK